ncbi:MAG TPA: YraN family protein [Acidimicrobiales bacterium]|nr:YraN family protein [Acidimicrobiales bacterium]
MTPRRELVGRRGEEAAARFYESAGFTVIDRNWRCPQGELDLVVADGAGGLLVFCEVKTRTSSAFGSPAEAVTPAKVRRLRRLAGHWMAEARPSGCSPSILRVDVAVVRPGPDGRAVVEVVENAC